MKPTPVANFQFSVKALMMLTACVAFLASAWLKTPQVEPSAPPLVVNSLPLRGNTPLVDSIDGAQSTTQAEMERIMDQRRSSIYQSVAAAIAKALGNGANDVIVSRVDRTSPNEPFTVEATWSDSSTPRVLKLQRIESNRYRATARSSGGSPELVLMLDFTGTLLDEEANAQARDRDAKESESAWQPNWSDPVPSSPPR